MADVSTITRTRRITHQCWGYSSNLRQRYVRSGPIPCHTVACIIPWPSREVKRVQATSPSHSGGIHDATPSRIHRSCRAIQRIGDTATPSERIAGIDRAVAGFATCWWRIHSSCSRRGEGVCWGLIVSSCVSAPSPSTGTEVINTFLARSTTASPLAGGVILVGYMVPWPCEILEIGVPNDLVAASNFTRKISVQFRIPGEEDEGQSL